MKKTKIIVPALGLLLLSTAASVTGTVAWFSANTKVEVNGMQFSTQVSGNLLIANHNAPQTKAGVTEESGSMFSTSPLKQEIEAILEPASTVDGVNYYYTVNNVSGTGAIDDKASTSGESKDGSDLFTKYVVGEESDDPADGWTDFSETYGFEGKTDTDGNKINAVAYVDYNFYLKGTSTEAGDEIYLNKANILVNGEELDATDTAWRIAVFSQEVNKDTDAETVGTLDTIVSLIDDEHSAANYFTAGKAVNGTAYNAYGDVSKLSDRALLGSFTAKGQTKIFNVVVRLWLEGEDVNCNNDTYALLTDAYTLDLECRLGAPAAESATPNGLTQITSVK